MNTTFYNYSIAYSVDQENRAPLEKYLTLVFQIMLTLAIVLNNSLVVASVVLVEKLRDTLSNYFILNLAVADLCCGLFVVPVLVHCQWYGVCQFNGYFCSMSMANNMALQSISTVGTALISIDKYIFVIHPLRYHQMITPRRVGQAIVTTWVLTYIIGVGGLGTKWAEKPITEEMTQYVYYPLCYIIEAWCVILAYVYSIIIPVCVSSYTGFHILRVVRFHNNRVVPYNPPKTEPQEPIFDQTQTTVACSAGLHIPHEEERTLDNLDIQDIGSFEMESCNEGGQDNGGATTLDAEVSTQAAPTTSRSTGNRETAMIRNSPPDVVLTENGTRKLGRADMKAIKAVGIVIITLFLMWAPFYVIITLPSFSITSIMDYHRALQVSVMLGFANCALNPILYAKNKDFRDAYKQILHCKCRN
ncbi:putative G-protein coupled receptor No18 [Glandiceps talaboti]